MQCRIDMAMKALERLDPARLGIISKRIEHGARHMIVDPVDPTGIARTRIGFQVVNAHAASWPLPDAKMSIVDPDVASALRGGPKVDGHDERSFRRDGRGPLRQPYLGHQVRDGHLLAVRWSSPRSSRHVSYLRFGIRFANGHSASDRNG